MSSSRPTLFSMKTENCRTSSSSGPFAVWSSLGVASMRGVSMPSSRPACHERSSGSPSRTAGRNFFLHLPRLDLLASLHARAAQRRRTAAGSRRHSQRQSRTASPAPTGRASRPWPITSPTSCATSAPRCTLRRRSSPAGPTSSPTFTPAKAGPRASRLRAASRHRQRRGHDHRAVRSRRARRQALRPRLERHQGPDGRRALGAARLGAQPGARALATFTGPFSA